jgi:hypothetical protein
MNEPTYPNITARQQSGFEEALQTQAVGQATLPTVPLAKTTIEAFKRNSVLSKEHLYHRLIIQDTLLYDKENCQIQIWPKRHAKGRYPNDFGAQAHQRSG